MGDGAYDVLEIYPYLYIGIYNGVEEIIYFHTGVIYSLTDNGWKASGKSIKGPVGDALNIEAEYHLTERADYQANLDNGVAYIEANYT